MFAHELVGVDEDIQPRLPLDEKQSRANVFALEKIMQEAPEKILPDGHIIELNVVNHFSKGVYARELHIPAGCILTGEIHKYQNLNILLKGDISVLTENGVVRVQAPFTIVSPPGTKRIAYAHEYSIWTTIVGTTETNIEANETNIDKIKEHFIASSEEEYIDFCNLLQISR